MLDEVLQARLSQIYPRSMQMRSDSTIIHLSFSGISHIGEDSMFKRIIVAIDGSRTSRLAFEAALDLAGTHGAALQAYYVVENAAVYFDVPGYDPSILRQQLIDQGSELGRDASEAMTARGVAGSIAVGEASSLDDVSALVLDAAKTFNADLLVMGTHGRKGFQRLILGSVAERCLRSATLPVLLIPAAAGNA
jgi:nucleotide-binding universal stress UspA family protein